MMKTLKKRQRGQVSDEEQDEDKDEDLFCTPEDKALEARERNIDVRVAA